MQKLRSYSFVLATLISPFSLDVIAQENQSLATNLNIPYSQQEAIIDGKLDDDIWKEALSVSLDIVNSPWDNLPSPVKTEAKIIENGEFIYISFTAYDPNPEKIQGFLGDRDTRWFDDIVGIKLDTQNNRRLNYEFFVNPFGVQNDAIFDEITGKQNDLWDGIWQSYGKITEQGYQVEMAIPYNILNFKEDGQIKNWAIELIRSYPRETRLRLSHVPLNRDDPCWLCQYPEAVGFKHAQIGNNLRLTPAITASKSQTRDIYSSQDDWQDKNDIEAGIDLRWGINANTSLSATLNPDFSTVESDAGQLSINTNFSLFYNEKRAFFLDNSDYFSSNYDLVYTRNIADPDYGIKLTGREQKHTYGIFATNDTETNFISPDNLSSSITSLDEESHSAALRYRYDYSDDLSFGAISTLRQSNSYYNYLVGIDSKFRFNDSNMILAQVLGSNTEQTFDNNNPDDFSDQAIKIDFKHNSEYWIANLSHQSIGKSFRADLGFMPKTDIKINSIDINRIFYAEQDSFWQEITAKGQWKSTTNENNEFIEQYSSAAVSIDGPKLSIIDFKLIHAEKVGLRHDENSRAIDNNTKRFTENQFSIYSHFRPTSRTFLSADILIGDKIDYAHDRLGEITEISGNLTWNLTNHLEIDIYQTYSKLKADNTLGKNIDVYTAHLSDLRVSYQFDVLSYLKLSVVYSNIDRQSGNEKDLSTQLIYAYKLNPQTVFFLGYSDNGYQDKDFAKIEKTDRTLFTKISYSWQP